MKIQLYILVLSFSVLLMSCGSSQPSEVGASMTTLSPCPSSPNCVITTEDGGGKKMATLPFKATRAQTKQALEDVINATPRTSIETSTETYLHAVFTTKLMKFKDDVEFILDPELRVVHFRSASRVGHSDMGANKKRMTAFTKAYSEWSSETTE